jgi:hypothetical protein
MSNHNHNNHNNHSCFAHEPLHDFSLGAEAPLRKNIISFSLMWNKVCVYMIIYSHLYL